MNMYDYKKEVVETAINSMVSGGMSREEAQVFEFLFDRIFICGYNEGKREQYEVFR